MLILGSIFDFLITGVSAGIIATSGMMLVLWYITKKGYANADMVGAIGSLLTRSMDSAYRVGTLIHLCAGVFFACGYLLLLQSVGVSGTANIFAGLFIGLIHGYIVSFLLVVSIAEHHPVPKYKQAGVGIAIGHFVGHAVYGLLVGLSVYLSGFSVDKIENNLIASNIIVNEYCEAEPYKAQLNPQFIAKFD